MLLLIISLIIERTIIDSPISPPVQTSDKSPLEYTFKAGLGFAIVYWSDAIINITDDQMTKRLSVLDKIRIFTFSRQTDVTITFQDKFLFYAFAYPEKNSKKVSSLYPIIPKTYNTPSYEVEDTIVYFTAYCDDYYVDVGISPPGGTITIEYDYEGHHVEPFNKAVYFRPDFPLKNLKISSTVSKMQINYVRINCTKDFESSKFDDFVAVEVYTTNRDMSRGHVGYKDGADNSILISEIKPKELYTLKIDTTSVEDEFKISYKHSLEDTEFKPLNSILEIEGTKRIDVYLYATSLTSDYPECKNSPLFLSYSSGQNHPEEKINKDYLPSSCRPPVAKITIFSNLSSLGFSLFYKIKYQSQIKDDEYTYTEPVDFNISILAGNNLCPRNEVIKEFEVKVGQHIKVNITSDDIPRACKESDKNSVCYYELKEDYEKCLEMVEGRVIRPELLDKLKDHPENYTIILLRNMTANSNIFKNHHDVIIGPNCTLKLSLVEEISGSKDTKLKVDNLTFDPNDNNKIKLYSTKHLKFWPAEGEPLNEIDIYIKDQNVIFEALDDKAESSKYPPIFIPDSGKLNLFDYPVELIRSHYGINIVNGAYIICNYESEKSNCPKDFYNGYKIHNVTLTAVDMKLKSNLYIFLDTFDHNINIDINKINLQPIYFIENEKSNKLLEEEKPKVRFLSTKKLTFGNEHYAILGNETANIVGIKDEYEDKFRVVVEDILTIQQISKESSPSVCVEPINDDSIIFFDDSVTWYYTIHIDVDMRNTEKVNTYTNMTSFTYDMLTSMLKCESEMCTDEQLECKMGVPPGLENGEGGDSGNDEGNNEPNDNGKKDNNKNKLSGGAIAGIVIGVVVVIAAVVAAVIIIRNKKKNQNASSDENDDKQENI